MSAPLVECQQLFRAFGPVLALNDVNLRLEGGPPIGLVGPNGAGKTTLFAVLCGFLRPHGGHVQVLGRTPGSRGLRGRVTLLPQDAALRNGIPVLRQLTFLARLQGLTRDQAVQEAHRVLDVTLARGFAHKGPETLSHGQLKRVLIAQALMGSPDLVLLDEPTAGLDPEAAQAVHDWVRAQSRDQNFIVSSHNLKEIEDLCDTVVIIDQGRVMEVRRVAELVGRADTLVIRLEQAPTEDLVTSLKQLAGVASVDTGAKGEHRLVLHMAPDAGDQAQVAVIQVLSGAGASFLELARGESLARRYVDLTRQGANRVPSGTE